MAKKMKGELTQQLVDEKAIEQYNWDKQQCELLYSKIKSRSTQGAVYILDALLLDYSLGYMWQIDDEHQAVNLKRRMLEVINYMATDSAHSMLVAEGRAKP